MKKTQLGMASYEAQLMGVPKKPIPVKETYFCSVCRQVTFRYRPVGMKPYVKWCCGNKMVKIKNKCSICGKHIKGASHFQGSHHLAALKEANATQAAEIKFGMGMKGTSNAK